MHVILWRAARGEKPNPFATKEDVFILRVARCVRFRQDFASGAVPIELAADFDDSAAIGVASVVNPPADFSWLSASQV